MTTAVFKAKQNAYRIADMPEKKCAKNRYPKPQNEYFFEGNKIMYHSLTGIIQAGEVEENGDYKWYE